ncbi:glycosyltransferase family 2 protein [Pseudarthrobacter sp. SL88]|uniref:glycosyltransferase family 2 protein n=2 Tax=unclassified Pseudarthrobacter TaxID=2647000 RepID=UPI0022729E3B|nr:glycosyltransferase family 2 protein [Pseudarthrobacter sp. SL88]MCY1674284.1 glycosyltransferase family 2 protein [Pseudarthrobacter sp. SL88]MDQ1055474.1 glycosyltransferase involved in cell wall biosynthesis [Arthrobacter sp. SORGH_AS_0212]
MNGDGAVRVSVCMATYNGQDYVAEQIQSILSQLSPEDELVIVDDASKDSTLDVVRRLQDPRIVLLPSAENKGYVASFEKAVSSSRGEYIMLSDQDDIWLPGRVETLVSALQTKDFAASNFTVFGGPANRYHKVQLKESDSGRWVANLVTTWIGIRPYYGCTMAFRAAAKKLILPFPEFLTETHDQWIAIVANLNRNMVHVAAPTVARRLHDENTTPKSRRPVAVILRARIMLLRAIFVALGRKPGTP